MHLAKKPKKTFEFSDEHEMAFVEGSLNILSKANNMTPTAALANIIDASLLPNDNDAKKLCKELLSSKKNVFDALNAIFDWYSYRIRFNVSCIDIYSFLKFLHSELFRCGLPTHNKNASIERQLFFDEFFGICEAIKTCYGEANSVTKSFNTLYKEATTETECFKFINLTSLMKKEWNILRECPCSYNVLASMCRMLSLYSKDSAEDRLRLIEIIKLVSKEDDEYN